MLKRVTVMLLLAAIVLTLMPAQGVSAAGGSVTQTGADAVVYMETMTPSSSDRYIKNEGDSFIAEVGTRNSRTGLNGTTYQHGLEAWVARWNGTAEISWVWNEYTLSAQFTTLKGTLTVAEDCWNRDDFDSSIEIYGDGIILSEQRITGGFAPIDFEVDVSNVNVLKIYAGDYTAKKGGTSFLLGDLRLLRADGSGAAPSYPADLMKDGNVVFGTYQGAAMEWIILDRQNGKTLLLSKDLIDVQPYNEVGDDNLWETSLMREWLNYDFYNQFSIGEKAKIQTTDVVNYPYIDGTEGGSDTKDKIFLLSAQEVEQYLPNVDTRIAKYNLTQEGMEDWARRNAERTAANGNTAANYDYSLQVIRERNGKPAYWFLRTPGASRSAIIGIFPSGRIDTGDFMAFQGTGDGVRPAMWVSGLLTSDPGSFPPAETSPLTYKTIRFWNGFLLEKELAVDVPWGDALFSKPSDEYSSDLALVSIALCAAAHNSPISGRDWTGEFMDTAYSASVLDFDDYKMYSYKKSPRNVPETEAGFKTDDDIYVFSIADKKIVVNGQERNLITVVLRGTGSMGENLKALGWKYAKDKAKFQLSGLPDMTVLQAFKEFYDDVYKAMEKYLNEKGYSKTPEKNVIYITGHSLGAAAANLVAAKLSHEQNWAYADSVYCYAFATPLHVNSRYDFYNIFNIINPMDNVPTWVPWLFSSYRFGVTRMLPAHLKVTQDLDYVAIFQWGKLLQSWPVDTRYHDPFMYKLAYLLDYSGDYDKARVYIKDYLTNFGLQVVAGLGLHNQEFYIAWMETNPPLYGEITSGSYIKVACPVDVEVYDAGGELVGKIAGDTVDEDIISSLSLFVEGDEKYIYISPYDEEEYTLKLTATDDGTMDFSVGSVDLETGESEDEKSFLAVPLTAGKTMTAQVGGEIDPDDIQLLVTDEQGSVVDEVTADGRETQTDAERSGGKAAADGKTVVDGKTGDDKKADTNKLKWILLAVGGTAAVILIIIIITASSQRKKRRGNTAQWNCPNCGTPLNAGETLCRSCGTPIAAQPAAARGSRRSNR